MLSSMIKIQNVLVYFELNNYESLKKNQKCAKADDVHDTTDITITLHKINCGFIKK